MVDSWFLSWCLLYQENLPFCSRRELWVKGLNHFLVGVEIYVMKLWIPASILIYRSLSPAVSDFCIFVTGSYQIRVWGKQWSSIIYQQVRFMLYKFTTDTLITGKKSFWLKIEQTRSSTGIKNVFCIGYYLIDGSVVLSRACQFPVDIIFILIITLPLR